ncbi:predicted protein [Streptomyces viridosporus ATCC 14672]|uniref:Predicted protein n=1 Tax=Streptomyces viridosporus (strain ATCC 14672 / DSM 40746 / JCM 4963 / KCTC 9882 / NRRL B-12104 / FH 1290) TaxID=566461 RepID=D6A3T9_STRV1|nr:predicted protein [Streptomyces viridosporus ATCC 14672]
MDEIRRQSGPRRLPQWYTALFVPFLPAVPHTDTGRRTRHASVKLRSIMRFGLLLLSCRGEGLQ